MSLRYAQPPIATTFANEFTVVGAIGKARGYVGQAALTWLNRVNDSRRPDKRHASGEASRREVAHKNLNASACGVGGACHAHILCHSLRYSNRLPA